MEIYFGKLREAYQETTEAFTDGINYFYFKASIYTEGAGNGHFNIEDTCGRSIPFDFSNLQDLYDLIGFLLSYSKTEAFHTKRWAELSDALEAHFAK